jgi:DNA invertase Pin-like site-specific DNA recombinase/gas vesicle protein
MKVDKVAIYNRCSTEEEAQVNALKIQIEESRERAIDLGWEVVDQYIESESGTSTDKRKEYQRLFNDLSTDKFDIVMIKSVDRLARNTYDWYTFLAELIKNQKRLYMYIDNKFYTDQENLITGIKAIIAEDFSRELSKKIKNAHKRRQEKKSGLNITCDIYGWDNVGRDKFIVNEEEAAIVREIFCMAKDKMGRRNIARTLEKRGIVRKNGTPLSETNIRDILNSTKYYGTMVLHKNEVDFNLKKRVKLPPSEWIYIENALPPIITKEFYDEVHRILDERNKRPSAYSSPKDLSKVGKHKLSGKLYCGECGSVYYRFRPKTKSGMTMKMWKCSKAIMQGRGAEDFPNFGCHNRNVYEHNIYDAVERACRKRYDFIFNSNEGVIDELISIIKQVISSDTSEIELIRLRKQLDKHKQKKNILFDKLMDETIKDYDFKIYNEKLDNEIRNLEDKISKFDKDGKVMSEYENRLAKIIESLKDEKLMAEAKTAELITRIDKIIVYGDKLEILFDKDKLNSLLKIYGNNLIDYNIDEGYFKLEIDCLDETEFEIKKKNKRQEINESILNAFKNNPKLKLIELYQMIDMGESYINTSIKILKDEGRLKNVRNGRYDYKWFVVDDKEFRVTKNDNL